MERIIIPYTNEEAWLKERSKDLTSSDMPCLFGCGYMDIENLKMIKGGYAVSNIKENNERMQWGVALQDAIANEFARQNKWNIRKKTEYIRIPELRLGSSFDFEIEGIFQFEGKPTELVTKNELLEIKNVDSLEYKNKWITTGFEIEATPYIELQVQHQLLVSGLQVAYIGALIGGNKGVLLRREANPKIQKAILKRASDFWNEIDNAK